MPKSIYVSMVPKVMEISGVLESENTTTAIGSIREMGYFPTNVTEIGKDKKSLKSSPALASGPVKGIAKGRTGKGKASIFSGSKNQIQGFDGVHAAVGDID